MQCLAAHPGVVAWREFDPIGASYSRVPCGATPASRLVALYWTLRGRLDLVYEKQKLIPKSSSEAFAEFFMGTGWVPVNGAKKQAEIEALPRDDLELLADNLFRIIEKGPKKDDESTYSPAIFKRALGIANFKRRDLIKMMQAVSEHGDTRELPRLFYNTVVELCDPSAVVAFKAADQVMTLPELLEAMPQTKIVFIVRDARDAVVSASAFQDLMREQETPWQDDRKPSFAQAVYSWALRVSLVTKYSELPNVYVLRYEDLIADFEDEIAGVYQFLGLPSTDAIVRETRELTDFQLMSGGRKRGDEAASVFRKGIVGDWHTKLSAAEKELSWRIARRQLGQLGYTKDGSVVDSKVIVRTRP